MSEQVKCVNCGLFALWHRTSSGLEEYSVKYRMNGLQYAQTNGTTLNCFAMAIDIEDEILRVSQEVVGNTRALQVIDTDRECPMFTPWKSGYSPREMLDKMSLNPFHDENRSLQRKSQPTILQQLA